MKTEKITISGATLWHDRDLLPVMEPGLFEPAWLRQSGALTGSSTGRNEAWFLHHGGIDMVLRHFWRGGLVGRFNRDLYLRVPVGRSRAMAEYQLLGEMRDQGLPVPRPVAARFQPAGPFYRADLITERIPDSRTMAELLRAAPLAPEIWAEAGAATARMHAFGVDHPDLNCRNILIDGAKKAWLIDFDKAARREDGSWKQENLARLQRSFAKEKGKFPDLFWSNADHEAFMAGYRTAAQ